MLGTPGRPTPRVSLGWGGAGTAEANAAPGRSLLSKGQEHDGPRLATVAGKAGRSIPSHPGAQICKVPGATLVPWLCSEQLTLRSFQTRPGGQGSKPRVPDPKRPSCHAVSAHGVGSPAWRPQAGHCLLTSKTPGPASPAAWFNSFWDLEKSCEGGGLKLACAQGEAWLMASSDPGLGPGSGGVG